MAREGGIVATRMEAHRVAVFIDMENISAAFLEPIADLADTFGRVCHLAVYADWRQGNNRAAWGTTLDLGGVPKQIMKAGGPNSADIAIVVDAVELLLRAPDVDVFVLATGDSDFVPLVQRLRAGGKLVVGAVPVRKGVRSVYEAAFDRIERLRDPADDADAVAPAPSKARPATPAPPKGPTAVTLDATRRALSSILSREGTLSCGELGGQLRDAVPGFNQRALGFRRLSDLLRAQTDLLRVAGEGDVLRVTLVAPPATSPAARPAQDAGKPAARAVQPGGAPAERIDWPRLRDHMLAVLLAEGAPFANDEELHAAMIALAKRTGGGELPLASVASIVARYPSCFLRSADGIVVPIVSLVDAYKLRLNRLWEPIPRDALRAGLALLSGIFGDESLTFAALAERLAAASNGELTQGDARAVVILAQRADGLVADASEPGSKSRVRPRPWLLDPKQAEAMIDAAALARMGPYLPVDPTAMAASLGVEPAEGPAREDPEQMELPLG